MYSRILLVIVLSLEKDEITHIEKETQQVTLTLLIQKYKSFIFVIIATVFLFFDNTLINNFFIQIIQHIGGNSSDMGNAIFLAAVLELPTMAYFTKMQKKIGCQEMLIISSLFFSVKHILTYFAFNMIMIYIAQFLQVFAYALFIPASVYYVNQTVEKTDMVKGQALITGAMTLSGVFVSLIGGMLLDGLGVQKVLLIGVICSVIGTICLMINLKNSMK